MNDNAPPRDAESPRKRQRADSSRRRWARQWRVHSVAIISLVTALAGLSYNSWRDHVSERNSTTRSATFQVLMALGELQTVVDYAHYGKDRQDRGNAITGWGHVLMVSNLSMLISTEAAQAAQQLFKSWQTNWESLDHTESAERITETISQTRMAVLDEIKALD